MERKKTRRVKIGGTPVGGGAPISVQSMTNTRTDDVAATAAQIAALEAAGCDLVRLAVPDLAAARAMAALKERAVAPLIADIHFDYRLALAALEYGADALRLNPGNIGGAAAVTAVVREAKKRAVPIRIGVNAGSLDKRLLAEHGGRATPEAMVESALEHVRILERLDFYDIKISLKAHSAPTTIRAYQLMAESVDYPLHLGITEAGTARSGLVKSAVGIGALLAQGIGDTIRVSLTGDPVQEVLAAVQILQSLDLRPGGPTLVSCPTCGRCRIDLAAIAEQVEEKLAAVKRPIKVAVMGCAVNGPGEAREADVGVAGGRGEGLLFRRGEIVRKVPESELVRALFEEIDRIIREESRECD